MSVRLASIALFAMVFVASPSSAEMYKWVDDKGGVHYTDKPENIPPKFRPKKPPKKIRRESKSPQGVKTKTPKPATTRDNVNRKIIKQPKSLFLIPAKLQGTFDQMWGNIKKAERLYLPVFGVESLQSALEKKGVGNVKASDFDKKYLFVPQELKGRKYIFMAVYSDARLFKGGTLHEQVDAMEFLGDALYSENSDGVYFNPYSRVCDTTKYAYGVNKYYVVELIGYIQAPLDMSSRQYHHLANEAARDGHWYLAAYYWGKSRREGRPGDDWKLAELSKLRAYYELNFPGSRDYAKGELRWFIREYGSTPEARALLKRMGG